MPAPKGFWPLSCRIYSASVRFSECAQSCSLRRHKDVLEAKDKQHTHIGLLDAAKSTYCTGGLRGGSRYPLQILGRSELSLDLCCAVLGALHLAAMTGGMLCQHEKTTLCQRVPEAILASKPAFRRRGVVRVKAEHTQVHPLTLLSDRHLRPYATIPSWVIAELFHL